MNTQIKFSQAVEGFVLSLNARHLSQNTINDYLNTYRKLEAHLGVDPPMREITVAMVRSFLAEQSVSNKTVLNYHTGLSSLWTWAVSEGLAKENIIQKIRRPKPEKKVIMPYSEEDIRALLDSLNFTRHYTRPGKRESKHTLLFADRNRAIILLLLDTGVRASELCGLKIHHINLKNRYIKVFGKGDKERVIPFCARTGQALWKYLATRAEDSLEDNLFSEADGVPMNRDSLLKMIQRAGRRAGIENTNIHKFRHTFAINYLRNGGDPWSLQMMLGHSTMEMVKTYLALAQADLEKTHKVASPVDNWRL